MTEKKRLKSRFELRVLFFFNRKYNNDTPLSRGKKTDKQLHLMVGAILNFFFQMIEDLPVGFSKKFSSTQYTSGDLYIYKRYVITLLSFVAISTVKKVFYKIWRII